MPEAKQTKLPLISEIPSAMADNPATGDQDIPPTITVQMNAIGGDSYSIEFTMSAAKDLLVILARWPPVRQAIETPDQA